MEIIDPKNTKKRMDERLEMIHKLYPDAKPTNADSIRAMTDEELARFFTDDLCELLCHFLYTCDSECELHMLTWLKKECE